jgi:hypothetical protein
LSTGGYKYEESVRRVTLRIHPFDLRGNESKKKKKKRQTNSRHELNAMGSIDHTVPPPRKFNTSLTDFSTVHEDNTGPYAENLTVDALIVGAGFGKAFSPPIKQPAYHPHPSFLKPQRTN